MPNFISKLQYKTCEEGEYYDEKARGLEETIELIDNFPWAREQYADLDLTGPSITIKDEQGNYLKVGIYYGGRFSLYYLDSKNRLYQYRQVKMDKVHEKVAEFFEGKLQLEPFEKQPWGSGGHTYFLSKEFEYRIKIWRILMAVPLHSCLFLLFPVLLVITASRYGFTLTVFWLLVLSLAAGGIIKYLLEKYRRLNFQYLKISRGNDLFYFGCNHEEIKTFNKADISGATLYVNRNSRSSIDIEIYEIRFIDGSVIKFSDVLISQLNLSSKFSDKWKFSPKEVKRGTFELLQLLSD